MLKLQEDNSGFVNFPNYGNRVLLLEGIRTLIYLVSFEIDRTIVSNNRLILPGDFISDDIVERVYLNDVTRNEKAKTDYDKIYFPNSSSVDDSADRLLSVPIVTSICIGWCDDGYEFADGTPWRATYRDLTEEGRKLYYSIKKLHNNKEVRILTFNNI